MLLIKKYVSLRYIYNNFFRSFFIFCPILVLFILLFTRLKSSSVVHDEESSNTTYMRFVSTVHRFRNLKFHKVREFQLSIKKFDNEDARLVGFSLKGTRKVKQNYAYRKIIYLATPYFLQWNPKHYYFLHFGADTFKRYQCPINSCYVTNKPSYMSKSHAVLFHVRDLEVFSLSSRRSSEQIWILYSMEPPWLEIRDMRRLDGVFNWTMGYRRDSDVLMTYGFIGQRPQTDSEEINDYSSDNFQNKINKAVWYVSNCETDSNREEYIARLKKVYPVDIIGGCTVEGCRPAETKKCYSKIANHYKFYLAFENAICRDYVTEKLYNSLEYYIIPITFGGVNYSDITPDNSIINAMEFMSPEKLGLFLWEVSRNETLYLSYFEWKKTYRSYLQPWMCDLCEKLHNPVPHQTKYNLESWWNEGESCLRWTTQGLKPIRKHPFPNYLKNIHFNE